MRLPPTRIATETGETVLASPCPVTVTENISYDVFVSSENDDEISRAIANRSYSFPEHYPLLLKIAPPGGRILDLGAHVGTFSLYAAAHGYQVLAVEASPRNAALLKATVARNGLENVTVVRAAVGDHHGSLEFVQAGAYGHVAGSSGTPGAIRLPAFTADRLVSQQGWDRVDFVKMDIEGSEVSALDGMTGLLASNDAPAILYESNGYTLGFFGKTPRELSSRLTSAGYRCFLIRSHQLVSITRDALQLECNVDCLAVKRWPILLSGWEIVDRMDPWAERFFAEQCCRDPNPVVRAYVGRTLQAAGPALLGDWRIASRLNALKKDPEADVREAVAWWRRDRWVRLRAARHYVRAGGRRIGSLLPGHVRSSAN